MVPICWFIQYPEWKWNIHRFSGFCFLVYFLSKTFMALLFSGFLFSKRWNALFLHSAAGAQKKTEHMKVSTPWTPEDVFSSFHPHFSIGGKGLWWRRKHRPRSRNPVSQAPHRLCPTPCETPLDLPWTIAAPLSHLYNQLFQPPQKRARPCLVEEFAFHSSPRSQFIITFSKSTGDIVFIRNLVFWDSDTWAPDLTLTSSVTSPPLHMWNEGPSRYYRPSPQTYGWNGSHYVSQDTYSNAQISFGNRGQYTSPKCLLSSTRIKTPTPPPSWHLSSVKQRTKTWGGGNVSSFSPRDPATQGCHIVSTNSMKTLLRSHLGKAQRQNF